MADLQGFNAAEVEPSRAFDPLPAGKYTVVVIASEEKPTAKGDGSYLEFVFEVIEGDHKGRKLWSRLNINNPSQKAMEIARSELSALCRAVGVLTPNDSEDLHDLPLVAVVALKRTPEGNFTNEVKGYLSVEAAKQKQQAQAQQRPAQAPANGQQAQQQPPPSNGQRPGWMAPRK